MYTRQRLVDFSDISIKQINDNFSAIFLKLSGNIDTVDLKNNSITTPKIVDGAITADKINVGVINIGHLEDGFVEGLELLNNPVFSSYAEQLQIINGHVANHATLIQQNANEINLQATAIDGLGTDLSNFSIRVDEIFSTVQSNKEYVDNQIVLIDNKFASVESTISEQWSSITQRADSIETSVSNVSTTVTSNYNELTGELDIINDDVSYHNSQIIQLADQITSKVSYIDYNGREIASLINQDADRITISADAIDLEGITRVSEMLYVGGRYYDGCIVLASNFTDGSIDFDGESIVISAMSGVCARSLLQNGIIITDDMLDSYVGQAMEDAGAVMSYYNRYTFYLDYDNGSRIYVRDRYGDIVGYLAIA